MKRDVKYVSLYKDAFRIAINLDCTEKRGGRERVNEVTRIIAYVMRHVCIHKHNEFAL